MGRQKEKRSTPEIAERTGIGVRILRYIAQAGAIGGIEKVPRGKGHFYCWSEEAEREVVRFAMERGYVKRPRGVSLCSLFRGELQKAESIGLVPCSSEVPTPVRETIMERCFAAIDPAKPRRVDYFLVQIDREGKRASIIHLKDTGNMQTSIGRGKGVRLSIDGVIGDIIAYNPEKRVEDSSKVEEKLLDDGVSREIDKLDTQRIGEGFD